MPFYYPGFYGNGLSMYGPPVPTGKPIPGVFGGGDSQFFDPIPPAYLYPGWVGGGWVPLAKPGPLPAAVVEAPAEVPPPADGPGEAGPAGGRGPGPAGRTPGCSSTGPRRRRPGRSASSPPRRWDSTASYTYELRAEWTGGRADDHAHQAGHRPGRGEGGGRVQVAGGSVSQPRP